MFTPRAQGVTLRRAQEALHNPHDAGERFDPLFPVVMRCSRCGKFAQGPRGLMKEAMEEHWQSTCEARHTKADAPMQAQIFYPQR